MNCVSILGAGPFFVELGGRVRFRRRVYVRYIRTAYVLTVATAYACGQYYIGTAEPEWLAEYLTDLIFQTSK